MRHGLTILLAATAPLLTIQAQDAAGGDKPRTKRAMRLLAIGDAPPFRQEVRNGIRYELPPPPGSVPPREVAVGVPLGEQERSAGSVRLQLGRMSPPLEVAAGTAPLLLRDSSDGEQADPWLKLRPPEEGDFIGLLWRSSPDKKWDDALAFAIPGTSPAGSVTFVNISPVTVGIVLGEEKFALAPARPLRRPLPPAEPLPFSLAFSAGDEGLTRQTTTTIEQQPGERSLVVIYRADGVAPRRPFGIVIHRERVAAAAPTR